VANEPQWTFHAYCTPAGGRQVQEWFAGLDEDSKEAIIDTITYMQHLPITNWQRPSFKPLGDGLSEIRCKVNTLNHHVRIYGTFAPAGKRFAYTLLLGTTAKKERNDRTAIAEARKRLGQLQAKRVFTHVFKFSDGDS
jgi:hypothetical protein